MPFVSLPGAGLVLAADRFCSSLRFATGCCWCIGGHRAHCRLLTKALAREEEKERERKRKSRQKGRAAPGRVGREEKQAEKAGVAGEDFRASINQGRAWVSGDELDRGTSGVWRGTVRRPCGSGCVCGGGGRGLGAEGRVLIQAPGRLFWCEGWRLWRPALDASGTRVRCARRGRRARTCTGDSGSHAARPWAGDGGRSGAGGSIT